jgi:hypothetical protein
MLKVGLTRVHGLVLVFLLFSCSMCFGQSKPEPVKEFPLWKFDELTAPGSCRNKGRFQDKEYCDSQVVDQILAQGKEAIPILISQLTDTRKTKHPIYDLWSYTAAGDIANTLLFDLFTASDWTIAPLPELESLQMECSHPGESCWRKFLRKNGREYVQKKWRAAWETNKDRIYWDEPARCFRLMQGAPKGELAGRAALTPATAPAQD